MTDETKTPDNNDNEQQTDDGKFAGRISARQVQDNLERNMGHVRDALDAEAMARVSGDGSLGAHVSRHSVLISACLALSIALLIMGVILWNQYEPAPPSPPPASCCVHPAEEEGAPPVASMHPFEGSRPVTAFCKDAIEGFNVDLSLRLNGFGLPDGSGFPCENGSTDVDGQPQIHWQGGRKVSWVEAVAVDPGPCQASPCPPRYEIFGSPMEWQDPEFDDEPPRRTPAENWRLVVRMVRK